MLPKKIVDLIKNKKPLPYGLDFTNKFIYYVGPVDPINNEVVGPQALLLPLEWINLR